jgi:hypothetical protein
MVERASHWATVGNDTKGRTKWLEYVKNILLVHMKGIKERDPERLTPSEGITAFQLYNGAYSEWISISGYKTNDKMLKEVMVELGEPNVD